MEITAIELPYQHAKRTIRIFCPNAYNKYKTRHLPVMYMLDGQNLFSAKDAYARPWYVQKYMNALALKYQCIIVGIDHGGASRHHELVPLKSNVFQKHSNEFLDFIIYTVKPFIDINFRVLKDATNTIICGSSLGGLFSYYAISNRPDVFSKAGVISPSFWICPEIIYTKMKLANKLFLVGSATESRQMSAHLQAAYYALKNNGMTDANLRVVIKNRGKHNELFWGRQFSAMVKWLLSHN